MYIYCIIFRPCQIDDQVTKLHTQFQDVIDNIILINLVSSEHLLYKSTQFHSWIN